MIDEEVVDEYLEEFLLEHSGVKGMKWGVRRKQKRTARQQKRIDRVRRVAGGTGSKTDKFVSSMIVVPGFRGIRGATRGAQLHLNALQKEKDKILAGKAKAKDLLNKAYGINMRDLNFSYN